MWIHPPVHALDMFQKPAQGGEGVIKHVDYESAETSCPL